jgi:N-methylhydantoinase B
LTRDGVEQTLPAQMVIDLPVQIGDEFTHFQPGPGGYGDPRLRSRDAVLDDLRNEKISMRVARDVYGVSVSDVAD